MNPDEVQDAIDDVLAAAKVVADTAHDWYGEDDIGYVVGLTPIDDLRAALDRLEAATIN